MSRLNDAGLNSSCANSTAQSQSQSIVDQLTLRVIPCLDVARGRVVKGVKFGGLVDMGDPVELAKRYQQQGADEIVLLDIAATVDARPTALNMVTASAETLNIPFTIGGGLRVLDDVWTFLDAGADKVALNTSAVLNPSLVEQAAAQFGSQAIVVAVDAGYCAHTDRYRVHTHGGKKATELDAVDWCLRMAEMGAGEILLTVIDRDGTGEGFAQELLQQVSKTLPIQVIASGGARHPDDFYQAFVAGADAALAAGMFHRNEYTVADVKNYLIAKGLPIRPPSKEVFPC